MIQTALTECSLAFHTRKKPANGSATGYTKKRGRRKFCQILRFAPGCAACRISVDLPGHACRVACIIIRNSILKVAGPCHQECDRPLLEPNRYSIHARRPQIASDRAGLTQVSMRISRLSRISCSNSPRCTSGSYIGQECDGRPAPGRMTICKGGRRVLRPQDRGARLAHPRNHRSRCAQRKLWGRDLVKIRRTC